MRILVIMMVLLLCLSQNAFSEMDCAKEGERFSPIYDGLMRKCCRGLTEWKYGMDQRFEVGDKCFMGEKSDREEVGYCLACGNNICEPLENVCNCPRDCMKEKGIFDWVKGLFYEVYSSLF